MIISDTNILASFAAAGALPQLRELLGESVISIPPAVEDELRAGIAHRANHLQRVISAIEQGHISVLSLDKAALALTTTLPDKLHAGEREAIVLARRHRANLLTNDRRAIRYCDEVGIPALDLKLLLRELWLERVITQAEVRGLIQKMVDVDKTVFLDRDLKQIFAPRRRRKF